MPQTTLCIQWPDRTRRAYYSPSTIVHTYFPSGETYTVGMFLQRSRRAYQEASDRVQAKFGMACTGAAAALAEIERDGQSQTQQDPVTVLESV